MEIEKMKPHVKYDRKRGDYRCWYSDGISSWWYGFGNSIEEAYINFCQINQFRLCDIGDTYHLAA
jgi:hypothetical protein